MQQSPWFEHFTLRKAGRGDMYEFSGAGRRGSHVTLKLDAFTHVV